MPKWAVDGLLALAAVLTSFLHAMAVVAQSRPKYCHSPLEPRFAVLCSLAALALLLHRRFPVLVFAVTASLMVLTEDYWLSAALVPLCTLAQRSHRWAVGVTVLFVAVVGASELVHLAAEPDGNGLSLRHYWELSGAIVTASSAAFLGQLLRTRRELGRSLAELREAQQHQRDLHARAVLARERNQLAREMHDVVSHQVSLIAVQAGALQVRADNRGTREAARTIRKLSVTTLDELRHMVTLLRAAGSQDREITPQPTREQLADLVADSGLDAELVGEVPVAASAAVERAVYRIVQEALTNVRKHAPGARATVVVRQVGHGLEVTVTNTAPTRPGLRLPSSRHGLVGLRERAENLDGTLTSGHTGAGGFRVHATLPDLKH
ncbi:sensor histidine kinase [Kitasatospora purpeofusca]|uniref:sensor histidine kinase n=1 Tax=Kitasatospora purpeofusca TaxID=67352 RepID=UPI0036B956FD